MQTRYVFLKVGSILLNIIQMNVVRLGVNLIFDCLSRTAWVTIPVVIELSWKT
jgi:hypothetical protein